MKRAQDTVRNTVTRPPLMVLVHPRIKVVVQTALQILKESDNDVVGLQVHSARTTRHMILWTLQLFALSQKSGQKRYEQC